MSNEQQVVQIKLVDTITKLDRSHVGTVVVGASHGGVYAGYCAARGRVRAVILNDAGIGKDRAGIGALDYLDRLGLAAATADSKSCRIADSDDMAANGIVSFVNQAARALGCMPGEPVIAAAERMRRAPLSTGEVPAYAEARFVIRAEAGEPRVIGCDSASLLRPEDAGQIVVAASHGALLNGRPDGAIGPDLLAIVLNDAGVGKDQAGIRRLPTLDRRGIAGATVAAASARIGDARSTYEDGMLSHVNATAQSLGIRLGMSVKQFVDLVISGRPSGDTEG